MKDCFSFSVVRDEDVDEDRDDEYTGLEVEEGPPIVIGDIRSEILTLESDREYGLMVT